MNMSISSESRFEITRPMISGGWSSLITLQIRLSKFKRRNENGKLNTTLAQSDQPGDFIPMPLCWILDPSPQRPHPER